MKRRQKLFLKNIAALIMISVLLGNGTIVFGQTKLQKIDGFYTAQSVATETIRAIYVDKKQVSFNELTTIFVGTNTGKVLSATMDGEDLLAKPSFKVVSSTQNLIRDIYFPSENKGYMLKNDGIYTSDFDGKTLTWNPFVKIEKLPQGNESLPRLYAMAFVKGTSKVCIGGAYIVKESDNQIDRQLLLCTDDITKKEPQWNEPTMPEDAQIQITSLNFPDREHGWAVGTEGTIWLTDNGGNDWKKQEVKIEDAFMSVVGLGKNKAWAVGYNNQIWYKSGNTTETSKNTQAKSEEGFKIGDIVEIKDKVFAALEIQINKKLRGRVTKVNKNEKKLKVTLVTVLSQRIRKAIEDYLKDEELDYDDVEKIPGENQQTGQTSNQNQNSNEVKEWNKKTIPALNTKTIILRNIKFASSEENEQYGWIVGDAGTILYTWDGGKNWQSVLTTNLTLPQRTQLGKIDFYSIFVDGNYCWVAGSKGTIVRIKYKQ